jgi:divalent metal cation (Fe/Co/Zn/Cd) transporter
MRLKVEIVAMSIKQLIETGLDNLTEEQLTQVYEVIKQLHDTHEDSSQPSLMARLKQIEIDAPPEFSMEIAKELGRDIDE